MACQLLCWQTFTTLQSGGILVNIAGLILSKRLSGADRNSMSLLS
jgi:hypothetical protein